MNSISNSPAEPASGRIIEYNPRMNPSSSAPLPHYGPPRDRRRRKRILTLRNVAIAALGVVVLFVLVNLVSERFGPDPGEHGRLYRQRAKTVPVVEEAPVAPVVLATPLPEAAAADPLLLDAARRAQYLGVNDPVLSQPTGNEFEIVPADANLPKLGGGVFVEGSDARPVSVNPPKPTKESGKRRIVISGDSQGVELRVD